MEHGFFGRPIQLAFRMLIKHIFIKAVSPSAGRPEVPEEHAVLEEAQQVDHGSEEGRRPVVGDRTGGVELGAGRTGGTAHTTTPPGVSINIRDETLVVGRCVISLVSLNIAT